MGVVPDVVPENTRQILGYQISLRGKAPDMAGVSGEGTTELQEEEHMGIN